MDQEKKELLSKLATMLRNSGQDVTCDSFQFSDESTEYLCAGIGCKECPIDERNFNKTIQALEEAING